MSSLFLELWDTLARIQDEGDDDPEGPPPGSPPTGS
jgi:hypothetical protein